MPSKQNVGNTGAAQPLGGRAACYALGVEGRDVDRRRYGRGRRDIAVASGVSFNEKARAGPDPRRPLPSPKAGQRAMAGALEAAAGEFDRGGPASSWTVSEGGE